MALDETTNTTETPAAGTGAAVTPEPQISAPKRRGRPPGSKNKEAAEGGDVKPNAVPDGAAVSKRGRPAKKKTQAINAGDLAKQIQGLHALGAMVTGIQELQLGEQEAEMLAKAVVAVSEQYNLAIDGKTGALIQLAAACTVIYLPRLVVLKKRKAAQMSVLHVVPDATPA